MTTQTPPLPTEPTPAADRLDKRVLMIAGVVVLGGIMSILDVTVVSVALQTFQQEFDATAAQVAWTMTGYTLALATVIPLTGWAADRFGTKRLYLLAVLLFTLGSILCALADSLSALVAFRVLQGLGGGMLMPLGMTILTRAAGPDRVGRVMAIMGIPMLLGPIFGPILGGWLIDIASWHWIFLINVPIGAFAIGYAWLVLDKDDVEPSETFDFVGMLLLSPGLALFLYGVSSVPGAKEEQGTPWTGEVIGTMVVGILLLIAFVPWALRRANIHPLVELRLLKNRSMTVALLTMSLFAISFFGASLLFPLYFQQVRGEDALGAGLLLAPQGIGAMLTMPVAGFLVDKIGPGKIVMTGVAVITLGMGLFTQIDAETSYTYLLTALFIMGLGMGATMMPIMTAALATLTDHTIARGSTLLNIQQQVAASIGTALFSVILTDRLADQPAVQQARDLAEETGGSQDPGVLAEAAARLGIDPAGLEALFARAADGMADAFATVFVVATVLVGCCLVPAFFLPRRKLEKPVDPTVMAGH
ncbi:DHA2 family efflux MFS transporter permease subunit [Nocardioides campestrisoli]|uniref:DHA2 family efflux MFS transporter permease subunit n=1 Tax=Nocardioides campestrisoli TaxID=2736757 RepID=UPI00295F425A|nr:DHA2 family efflux MFS transporter permease subunit [Nocardioides campestrisoli]